MSADAREEIIRLVEQKGSVPLDQVARDLAGRVAEPDVLQAVRRLLHDRALVLTTKWGLILPNSPKASNSGDIEVRSQA